MLWVLFMGAIFYEVALIDFLYLFIWFANSIFCILGGQCAFLGVMGDLILSVA